MNFNTETRHFKSHVTDSTNESTISNNMVVAIYMDSYGDIWIGTEKGINRFDIEAGEFTRFESNIEQPDSLSSDMAWAINEDAAGDLWIGTQSGGIHRWQKEYRLKDINTFEQYLDNVGIPSADIYTIINHSGNLWISHNNGITKLNIDNLSTINFDLADGLQGRGFNHGAAFKDKSGYLYFGGPNGFNRIKSRISR